ncbi:bifunctional [glutamine synthetase] adenylyltransferase/[glutamine synthetase]-adenylyl-L-tyrosine phosphorylase [Microbacterium sediminis]|uniref:Bifunctional glutamine-synthetase adenylyltransferase/deadenyltransferase n=1 Tax=Microbacterium sediminis TaxID=904291 RepID=A0A1B9N913_9MICO|nr:bifunctional [glutamine synthetase] adenylyltransferase/[glutamine synthetase]-adenylyl-L-tyrosine phosphorylase [Microbacterium sediminis]OCG73089.1 bifunctional glutamine-synthetase adenylyltransferase/deadenyltransferase [Microbacterium sediminis]QBR74437.1 bifunctional [glutamine synthetase] adenylyltransferase/[glutamine synthetase]-adenylyl-L-tyrosine phosphorylase [Microbacterium sediminis]
MSPESRSTAGRAASRTALVRLGFARVDDAEERIGELAALTGLDRDALLDGAGGAPDPDEGLMSLVLIARRSADPIAAVLRSPRGRAAAWRLLGASRGFGEFFLRRPAALAELDRDAALPATDEMRSALLASVGVDRDGFAERGDDTAWADLRIAYRVQLARIAAFDLAAPEPLEVVPAVSAALADLAGAALEASLAVARTRVAGGIGGAGLFPRDEVAQTRFAIIGMGKAGARELNYVSDVDVIFVADPREDSELPESRAIDVATRLAVQTMRGISGFEAEPPLWEVDANLRPEGKQGALVRTLESHVAYYDRWAQSWEFQALLKARPLAGDLELGERYIAALRPKVWQSAARENFVDGVQRMRERVTAHIPPDDVPYQLKLGPGGLRDIEFAVQLLQLVHGRTDDAVHQRGTIEALEALADGGYIGRADAAAFDGHYRRLRLMEHRLQLQGLSRTHLMPRDDDGQRVLARATGLAPTGGELVALWERVKREVRDIHLRIFYRPLLSAVAALPSDEGQLTPDQARDRLAAIGFGDPAGALRHIEALTSGISRKATITRHLMPVMLRRFADGVDPDYGLIAFRRVSETLGQTPWFLRVLRDSAGAADALAKLLSGSRYVGELMEWIPESVAWLDDDAQLRPRPRASLEEEARAIQSRHATIAEAMRSVRALRRRELLRAAMASILGVVTIRELSDALTMITEVTIQATVRAVRREVVPDDADDLDFAVIAMGRFGGAEIGFGSDADVLYVYRPEGVDPERAQKLAERMVAELRAQSEDHRLPLELDAGLRPEGRNGPIVRSLEAYREYYRRWSLSWEAQALLRAQGVAGSAKLIAAFLEMADEVRYPASIDPQELREIRRIKARVENERLPQGADPRRHLKLGPGGLSDVEWLVQVIQLQHAHEVPGLRTTSTLDALAAAVEAGLVPAEPAQRLEEAWKLASRLRSANTLLTGRTSDVLPRDRRELDGIGRILEYPAHSATEVEEDWLRTSRRARRDFEKLFYG